MSPDISSKHGLMLMRIVNDTCKYARSERTQETSDLHSCSPPDSSKDDTVILPTVLPTNYVMEYNGEAVQ